MSPIRPSAITPRSIYLRRRELIAAAMAAGLVGAGTARAERLAAAKSPYSTNEPLTPREDVTSYNNFYEFGTGKEDPARYAGRLTTKPWAVKIDGLVARPATYALEDLVKPHALEERIYRMRCVESWSMVIP